MEGRRPTAPLRRAADSTIETGVAEEDPRQAASNRMTSGTGYPAAPEAATFECCNSCARCTPRVPPLQGLEPQRDNLEDALPFRELERPVSAAELPPAAVDTVAALPGLLPPFFGRNCLLCKHKGSIGTRQLLPGRNGLEILSGSSAADSTMPPSPTTRMYTGTIAVSGGGLHCTSAPDQTPEIMMSPHHSPLSLEAASKRSSKCWPGPNSASRHGNRNGPKPLASSFKRANDKPRLYTKTLNCLRSPFTTAKPMSM
mmetsp:Transcript_100785/g.291424  ORF Transcript_100785/g.291424 Transcript_100785/m.291424 type:complete len:257 (+) Transcript_100785:467-1237(+)